jgi:hypothetical protein
MSDARRMGVIGGMGRHPRRGRAADQTGHEDFLHPAFRPTSLAIKVAAAPARFRGAKGIGATSAGSPRRWQLFLSRIDYDAVDYPISRSHWSAPLAALSQRRSPD